MKPAAAAKRRDWRRAWRALRSPTEDSERTEEAFALIDALDGPAEDRALREFAEHPEGKRLLAHPGGIVAASRTDGGLAAV